MESSVQEFSTSVNAVLRDLNGDEVSCVTLVKGIFKLHPEYAQHKAAKLHLTERQQLPSRKMLARRWLDNVRLLYRERDQVLDGRLAVFGLGLLDQELGKQLLADGFLDALVAEISDYPVQELLASEGQRLFDQLRHISTDQAVQRDGKGLLAEATPTLLDAPALIDELRRKPFAQHLAKRLRYRFQGRNDDRAFLVHIDGPWGAGKTTLLNFLRDELQRADQAEPELKKSPKETGGFSPWVVVNFNAWQHQRVGPPWWSLMDTVFEQALAQVKWRRPFLWLPEQARRVWTSWASSILALSLAAGGIIFLGVFLFWIAFPEALASLSNMGDVAKSLAAILSFVVALWGGLYALSRSLVFGSARSAYNFLESADNPMQRLSKHFEALIRSIRQPVTIFIDDLDRCQDGYAVELLEGIQTLFSSVPVTYVVAADRRWLRASYEKTYQTFKTDIAEPGRPLGYLFLEKAFQLSTSLPPIPVGVQEEYWNSLIRILETAGHSAPAPGHETDQKGELEERRKQAREEMVDLPADKIQHRLASLRNDPVQKQIYLEEAVQLMATPKAQAQTEHVLKPFAGLLEPNPRAMKRLVNAYGIQQVIALVAEIEIKKEQLALWTIVSLRWPLLAEFLADYPELVDYIKNPNGKLPPEASEELIKLSHNREVQAVVNGENIRGASLDQETIRKCAGLHPSASKQSAGA